MKSPLLQQVVDSEGHMRILVSKGAIRYSGCYRSQLLLWCCLSCPNWLCYLYNLKAARLVHVKWEGCWFWLWDFVPWLGPMILISPRPPLVSLFKP